jgi:hypothetical protein
MDPKIGTFWFLAPRPKKPSSTTPESEPAKSLIAKTSWRRVFRLLGYITTVIGLVTTVIGLVLKLLELYPALAKLFLV